MSKNLLTCEELVRLCAAVTTAATVSPQRIYWDVSRLTYWFPISESLELVVPHKGRIRFMEVRKRRTLGTLVLSLEHPDLALHAGRLGDTLESLHEMYQATRANADILEAVQTVQEFVHRCEEEQEETKHDLPAACLRREIELFHQTQMEGGEFGALRDHVAQIFWAILDAQLNSLPEKLTEFERTRGHWGLQEVAGAIPFSDRFNSHVERSLCIMLTASPEEVEVIRHLFAGLDGPVDIGRKLSRAEFVLKAALSFLDSNRYDANQDLYNSETNASGEITIDHVAGKEIGHEDILTCWRRYLGENDDPSQVLG